MATSVITANQSVKLCVPAGVTQVETAYLCGIFRNLGELVVACYKPREYEAFRVAQGCLDHADRPTDVRAFGFRFDEVGRAIAELWGLPRSVTDALNRPPALTAAPTDRTTRLAALTQLSADTTHAIYRTGRAQQTTKLKTAVLQYGNGLGVSEAAALDAARAAFAASAGALKAAQSSIDPAMFEERLMAIEETVKAAAGWSHGPVATIDTSAAPDNKCAQVADTLRGAFNGTRPLSTDEAIATDLRNGSLFRADPSVKRLRSASFVLLPVVVAGQPIRAGALRGRRPGPCALSRARAAVASQYPRRAESRLRTTPGAGGARARPAGGTTTGFGVLITGHIWPHRPRLARTSNRSGRIVAEPRRS